MALQKRAPEPEMDRAHVSMQEEFDSAKWTLPPFGVVAIVLLVIAVVIGLIAWGMRPKPAAAGTIDNVYAIAAPDGGVLATIQVSLRNPGDKSLYIKSIKASVKSDQGDKEDDALNASDFDRYFQGFPALKEHSIKPLAVETKIQPGQQDSGSVIVAFPLTVDQFNNRKALTVTVNLYDNKPVVITK